MDRPDENLPARAKTTFESLKRLNDHSAEYWSARELMPLLGYLQWRRFEDAVHRASTSCQQSGNDPGNHFAGAGKMVRLGSGSEREVSDYHLSRFACYLIAQNGDSLPSAESHRRTSRQRHPVSFVGFPS